MQRLQTPGLEGHPVRHGANVQPVALASSVALARSRCSSPATKRWREETQRECRRWCAARSKCRSKLSEQAVPESHRSVAPCAAFCGREGPIRTQDGRALPLLLVPAPEHPAHASGGTAAARGSAGALPA